MQNMCAQNTWKELPMIVDDRLIFHVFSAQQKLRIYLNNALTTAGVPVTVTQAGILFLLKQKDNRTMTELSQILGIDNSTMTGLTDRLEKAGFVKRSASPGDRRASHIRITPEGLAEVEGAKRVIRRVNEEIKKGHSDNDIEAFKRVLNGFFEKFNRSGAAKGDASSSISPASIAVDKQGRAPEAKGV
jgi:MarR family transcriptional regulator, organic hydroperoxide resistance regulator